MSKRYAEGAAATITRSGFHFKDIATEAEGSADEFYFGFAGGTISGTPGTYTVYQSMDNDDDDYEVVQEGGSDLEVVVIADIKNIIPTAMFNIGWIKLVGIAGTVQVWGAG